MSHAPRVRLRDDLGCRRGIGKPGGDGVCSPKGNRVRRGTQASAGGLNEWTGRRGAFHATTYDCGGLCDGGVGGGRDGRGTAGHVLGQESQSGQHPQFLAVRPVCVLRHAGHGGPRHRERANHREGGDRDGDRDGAVRAVAHNRRARGDGQQMCAGSRGGLLLPRGQQGGVHPRAVGGGTRGAGGTTRGRTGAGPRWPRTAANA